MRRWTLLVAILALIPEGRAFATEPSVAECLSASNASADLRRDHKLRRARKELLTCVSASCPAVVRDECNRRLDQVTGELPSVVFEVKDVAGHELSAVRVTVDGEVVADHLDGSAIDLDPGEHSFTFEASGKPPSTEKIVVHEGDKNRLEVVVISAPSPPPPHPLPPPPPTPTPSTNGGQAKPGGSGMWTVGLVADGVGIAGLIVGGVFGGLAFRSWGLANGDCPSHTGCSSQALDNRNHAVAFSTVSDVGFIAGGVLVALGVTLTLTAPRGSTRAVQAQLGPGWTGLTGQF
jgi:hypothetical protein